MLEAAVDHLEHNVLPAAGEYEAAEKNLSSTKQGDQSPAARNAKRKASDLATALNGLTDRCDIELGLSKTAIGDAVSKLCLWPSSGAARDGAWARIRGVATVYKHHVLTNQALPISSDGDVLVVGLGYGLDGFSVGKFGGAPAVLVQEKDGTKYKFMGDVVVARAISELTES